LFVYIWLVFGAIINEVLPKRGATWQSKYKWFVQGNSIQGCGTKGNVKFAMWRCITWGNGRVQWWVSIICWHIIERLYFWNKELCWIDSIQNLLFWRRERNMSVWRYCYEGCRLVCLAYCTRVTCELLFHLYFLSKRKQFDSFTPFKF
jgi:hypothetical protein